jgi:IS5 family transposase
MRQKIRQQLSFVESYIDHPHAAELATMSGLIEACPIIAALVHEDLVRGLDDPETGREGLLTAEQVFRAIVIKQMNGYSYSELAYHLADSKCYRAFCGIGYGDKHPSDSTLQRDIKRVRPETLEEINRRLITVAKEKDIEDGRKIRTDCTVVESNIHHPTDSSLLEDCVRVLSRLTSRAKEDFELDTTFSDHSRRAKKRALQILNAKSEKKRVKPYKDLLSVTERTVSYATAAAVSLEVIIAMGMMGAEEAAKELRHFISLAEQVISQTRRRVLMKESVPAAEKVVSIFEPHTDIIVKDRRDTYYGHKIAISGGASGLITDLVIEDGNPADVTLAQEMVERQQKIYGRVPRQVAYDGGFASKGNLSEIKGMGVKDVSFSKKCGLQIADMAKSTWVYKKLRDFRAGIEGIISFLKRSFGMRRCTWRGLSSFKAYAWSSVVTANLLMMARHLLS